MVELELERTYLAKALPEGLADCRNEIIQDVYIPAAAPHPILRLRHRGERYEITKKIPIDDADSTRQHEHTIALTPTEYHELAVGAPRKATKRRFYCTIAGREAEVDLYTGPLAGLVIIDFEFKTEAELAAFTMPDICLADVSQEVFAAGGVLAGKAYADIEPELQKYGYTPITSDLANDKDEAEEEE